MTIVSIPEFDSDKRAQAIGWFLSCAFHGTLIIGSFFFVKQVRLASQPEPFKWNVAIVSSEQALVEENAVPVPQAKPPQPVEAKPMPRQSITKAVPAPEPPQPKPTTVDPPPPPPPALIQEAALPPSPPATVPQSQPLELPEPPPVPTPLPQISVPEPTPEPLPIERPKLPEPKRASPPPPLTEVAKPEPKPPIPIQPIEQARIPEPAAIQPPPQKITQADPQPLPENIAEAPTQPPVQERVQETIVQPIPTTPVEAPPKVAQQPIVPPVQQPQETRAISTPPPTPPTAKSKPEAPPASTYEESPSASAQTRVHQEPAQEQVASLSPPKAPVRSKPDYRWLSELIVKRVEELKRYPAEARLEQAEGRVVVKVVIREDGTVSETEIVKSSGFRTLDEAALDLMRQSGPFAFPYPLGKPSLTIKVPINYALEHP